MVGRRFVLWIISNMILESFELMFEKWVKTCPTWFFRKWFKLAERRFWQSLKSQYFFYRHGRSQNRFGTKTVHGLSLRCSSSSGWYIRVRRGHQLRARGGRPPNIRYQNILAMICIVGISDLINSVINKIKCIWVVSGWITFLLESDRHHLCPPRIKLILFRITIRI